MKISVAIIGGGTAALFAAAFLDAEKYEVTIYEKKSTLGRKFLVAGDGGFNLTHSEPIGYMISRYGPSSFMKPALERFTNEDLVSWLQELGVPTYIGSSKRVFPEKGIKPITVLNAILDLLAKKGVSVIPNRTFTGWDDNYNLMFADDAIVEADIKIFALGGSSWKVTGSDGTWMPIFQYNNIETVPFHAANCAYGIAWPSDFIKRNEGLPLKNIAIESAGHRQKGEVVITKFGLEGNAIYALSQEINAQLRSDGAAQIYLDCKPTLTQESIFNKLQSSRLKTTEKLKQTLKLSATQIQLVKSHSSRETFLHMNALSKFIKRIPLTIQSAATIEESISTTGGVSLAAVTKNYQLKNLDNTYCIGEMLDWYAPTGGYLIQGCASMGVYLARSLNKDI